MRPDDLAPSDAVMAALSRAHALPRYRPGPWPPAQVRVLDRAEIGEELRRLESLDRTHDLAIVALAELGDADEPALRGELVGLIRDEWAKSDLSDRPGCIHAALDRRIFDGLQVERGAQRLVVDWLRPHLGRGEGRLHYALRWIDGDAVLRVRGEVRLPTALARALPLAPEWRARAEAALERGLDPADGVGADVVEALLQAMIPEGVGGRAGWLLSRGVELLGGGGRRPLVEATRGGQDHALYLISATHEGHAGSYGTIRLLVRVFTSEGGEIVDVREREIFAGSLAAADYAAPAPSDESTAIAAIDAWRDAARRYVAQPDVEVDGAFLIDGFFYASRPLALLATWVAEGPPGLAPTIRPRAVIDEARLAAAAGRARLVDDDEVEALRASVDDQLLAAIEVDGWLAMFCPCHRPAPGTFQEDRIRLRPPAGAAEVILMSDPWNGHVMPIDGDAALFRTVARFWRELLARMDVDVVYARPRTDADDEDEDEDDEDDEEEGDEDEDDEDDEEEGDEDEDDEDEDDARETSLRAWLRFPLPDPTPPFPAIDWRVYEPDHDLIADFNFWACGPFGMSPELRDRYEAAIDSHYHAYIRAVIDPDLGPRR